MSGLNLDTACYRWKRVLFFQNAAAHQRAYQEGKGFGHKVIAFIEYIPIIGQMSALFEVMA